MVCLDSDIIINALRDKGGAGRKLIAMKEEGLDLFTTSINTFELIRGVKDEKEKEAIHLYNFLSGVEVLDFDFNSSEKAAEIFNALKKNGNLLDIADIMIAAIAMANDEPLLTENRKHFERIPGLRLETL
jgi:tRNA(fMet)-specific endonuclease VapC